MINPMDVRLIWDDIRPGVEEIHRNLPWKDWRPEDVYASCLALETVVFVPEGAHPSDQFVVARITKCPRTSEKTMFFWLAFNSTGDADLAGKMHEGLEEAAIKSGCSAVEFITAHDKIVNHGKRFGYDKVMHHVRKDLPQLG